MDRWYSVYDKHFRPADGQQKDIQKYDQSSSGVLSLDELKRLAIEGVSASGIFGQPTSSEGSYRSLPLDGRVDLIHRDGQYQPPAAPQNVASVFPSEEQPKAQRRFDPIPMYQSSSPTNGSSGYYDNAWDHVPSIQKYATQLGSPNAPPAPPPDSH